MGSSSRHRDSRDREKYRDRERDRDRDRDRDRERDRDRDRERGDRDRDRREKRRSRERGERDRSERDRGRDRHRERDRERDVERRERETERREREVERRPERSDETNSRPPVPPPVMMVVVPPKEKTPEPPDGEKILAETLATIAATRNFTSLVQPKQEEETFNQQNGEQEGEESTKARRRRSRWGGGEHEKIFIPGMPTILPSNLNKDQEEAYLLQLQIEEVSRKLRSGDLGIPANPEERSPSPEPIYSSDGKRLNTREFRTRRKLEEERHNLVLRMQAINPDFKPPIDYKPPVIRVSDKVMIPQEEHPEINFVGLLIGPRGNTLKTMEKETGAKIIIRGKGSVKEGKVGRKDGQPLPGEDEPLHAYITATNPEHVKKAVEKIKEVIRQGVEVPENQNDLRRMQLRELAQLNGTLRENDGIRCNNCGASDHKSWLCPDKPNVTNNIVCSSCGAAGHIARDCRQKRPGLGGPQAAGEKNKIDEEYMSLMAELGEGPPPDFIRNGSQSNGAGPAAPKRSSMGLFDQQSTPRSIMPPPMSAQSMMQTMQSMQPPPWANAGMPPPWQSSQPGIMPPPPPPGASSPPHMMPWMPPPQPAQPPPPGASNGNVMQQSPEAMGMWPPPYAWGPAATCPPPPPPGIDMSSLLSAPPPPPPAST